ncbi:MAG: hypothetical protein U5R31_00580 [Acidimicrobiia bacterium]|nr:hypothetical protein [Acidimicrobiia bacterium]
MITVADPTTPELSNGRHCRSLRPGHSLEGTPLPVDFWSEPFAVGRVTARDDGVVFTPRDGDPIVLRSHDHAGIVATLGEAGTDGWLHGSELLWSPDLGHRPTADPRWWPTARRRVWWTVTGALDRCVPQVPSTAWRRRTERWHHRFSRLAAGPVPPVSQRPWERFAPPPPNEGPEAELPEWVVAWTVNCGGVAPGSRDRLIHGKPYTYEPKPSDECSLWSGGTWPEGIDHGVRSLAASGTINLLSLFLRGVVRGGRVVVPVGSRRRRAAAPRPRPRGAGPWIGERAVGPGAGEDPPAATAPGDPRRRPGHGARRGHRGRRHDDPPRRNRPDRPEHPRRPRRRGRRPRRRAPGQRLPHAHHHRAPPRRARRPGGPDMICPNCGAETVPVIYGLPTPDTMEAADRDEVVLGGCVIIGDEPTHACPRCGSGATNDALPEEGTEA